MGPRLDSAAPEAPRAPESPLPARKTRSACTEHPASRRILHLFELRIGSKLDHQKFARAEFLYGDFLGFGVDGGN